MSRPLQLSEQGQILEAAIEAAANAIINLRDDLNEWDSKVGDGDCGSTVGLSLNLILNFTIITCLGSTADVPSVSDV